MDFSNVRFFVVGAGFFGATIAERIAKDLGENVFIIEKRNHLGGNSYSEIDKFVHKRYLNNKHKHEAPPTIKLRRLFYLD